MSSQYAAYIQGLMFPIMDKEAHISEQEKINEALAIRYHEDIFQKGKLEEERCVDRIGLDEGSCNRLRHT